MPFCESTRRKGIHDSGRPFCCQQNAAMFKYLQVFIQSPFLLSAFNRISCESRRCFLNTNAAKQSITAFVIYFNTRCVVDSSWHVMAHGGARDGKWRGNCRMQWVASTLHTNSENGVSSITNADVHTSAASSRLNWRPLPIWMDTSVSPND